MRFAMGVVLIFVCLTGTAAAIRMQAGDIVVTGDGQVIPSKLPKYTNAPVRLKMHGKLTTLSGALPPILKDVMLEVDRDGEIETRGLPVCHSGNLQATTVQAARKICAGAVIGTGTGRAIIAFPEQKTLDISSPLTIFNGPNGANEWTIYVHAYITVPVPAAIVVKVDVERIDKGPLGYRVEATIPKIAGGAGIPASAEMEIGHEWQFKGERYSYLNGRCEDDKIQARGRFTFKDGTVLNGDFLKRCSVRP